MAEFASKGVAGAGLGLGIAGTALGVLNGGLGNVDKWLENDAYADGEGGLKKIPFKETKHFVSRVSKAWEKYDKLYS